MCGTGVEGFKVCGTGVEGSLKYVVRELRDL